MNAVFLKKKVSNSSNTIKKNNYNQLFYNNCFLPIQNSYQIQKLQKKYQRKDDYIKKQQDLSIKFENLDNNCQTQSIKEKKQMQQIMKKFQKQDEQARKMFDKQKQRIWNNYQAQDKRARAIINNQSIEEDQFKKECQICLVQIELDDIGTLKCGHMFHIKCINAYLKESLTSNKANIKCPDQQCSKQINENDIRQYTDEALYRKYQQIAFKTYVQKNSAEVSWCPAADCAAVFVFDQVLTVYNCPTCKKSFCLKCKTVNHVGMSCAEYRISNSYSQNDKKFEQFVKGAKYKQCPQCKFWVSKAQGCNHMTCRCKYQFCYSCGRQYPNVCKTC